MWLLIFSIFSNLESNNNQSDNPTLVADSTTTSIVEDQKDPNIVSDLQDVINAVVRIESLGLIDSEGYQEVGVGSGFFISNDGYIVTNNHVVAGSQGVEVNTNFTDLPIPASIVATSECNDLAVIKVEGNDYQYLEWYESEISPGLQIYAAGYPLATEEYTLLDGIVSKKRADGETSWASVTEVIEHTADILPGNSGGPLIDKNGKVVGVNYSGDDFGQAFAITSTLAKTLTYKLVSGQSVLSIGINPEAFLFEDEDGTLWFIIAVNQTQLFGAGILEGDIIAYLDGKEVGVDGVMTSFCDQLDDWDFYTPLPFEIYRYVTDEYLEGELLGNRVESTSDILPPYFDVEVCPQSLQIGETYSFNFFVFEGTSPLESLSVTFTDSTGNLVLDYDPSEVLEPYEDEEFGLVYIGAINENIFFEGTSNKGIVEEKRQMLLG